MGACRFPRWSPNDCRTGNAQARWIHGSAKVKPEGIRMSERVPSKTLKISLLVNRQANPEICDYLDDPANGGTSNAARVLMSLGANVLALTSSIKVNASTSTIQKISQSQNYSEMIHFTLPVQKSNGLQMLLSWEDVLKNWSFVFCKNNNSSDKSKRPITVHQSRLWLMYQIDKMPNYAAAM